MNKKHLTKYFLKNEQGQLVGKSESEMVKLIMSKQVKSDTQVFSTKFNKWINLKELYVFKNKKQVNSKIEETPEVQKPVEQINNELEKENQCLDQTVSKQQEELINLYSELEDAKTFVFHTQFESTQKVYELEVENQKLKERILMFENLAKEDTEQKKFFENEIKFLKKELTTLNKSVKKNVTETNLIKANSEIKNLNEQILLKDQLLLKSENFAKSMREEMTQLKEEIHSAIEEREQVSIENIKLKQENRFFSSKLKSYTAEIEKLHTEINNKKQKFAKLAQKISNHSDESETSQIELVFIKGENKRLEMLSSRAREELKKYQTELDSHILRIHELERDVFQNKINVKKEKALKEQLKANNEALYSHVHELESKIEDLSMLPPVPMGHITEQEHENVLSMEMAKAKKYEKELEELKSQLEDIQANEVNNTQMLEQKLLKKNQEVDYIKSRAVKMLSKKKQLEILAKSQKVKIKKLEEVKNALLKKFGTNVQDLQLQIASYKKEIEEQKSKNSKILNNISNVQKDEVLVDDLLNQQRGMADDEIVADEESVGELFEINNEPVWKLKTEDSVDGPYSFLEIKNMIEQREINSSFSIKKPGSPWKKIEDIFEFNTEVLTKKDDDETKLYIKREDLRVPLFEDVTIFIEDQEFQGKCSNLSSGGCFIESLAFNNKIFTVGKEMKVVFKGEGSHKNLAVKVQLRSITNDVPPGAGTQFLDMTEEKLSALNHFFKKFSKTFGKVAA